MIESRGIFAGSMAATLMGAAMLAGGCGEIAYKTGAGADALQADQRACKQGEIDRSLYLSCMKDKGWAIADLDGAPAVEPSATPPSAVAGSVTSVQPPPSGSSLTVSSPPVSSAVGAPAPIDPLRPVKVTTWVRFGGGGPADDIADCIATLGPANQPDIVHHTVTTALLACMRGKGWRGL